MKPYHQQILNISKNVDSFFSSAFNKVHVCGPQLDPAKIQEQPLMAISTHRSHVDYYLLGNEFIKKGFKNLRFAAGDNLTKLPVIGPKFLSYGAFPVSRDTGFERNYVRNLCSNVVDMMENGDLIIVFPEGGRSYSGATLDMKGGIVLSGIILQSKSPEKEVRYLPAAVSYECIPDLPYFKMLLKGKKYRKRTNFFLKRLIGNIYYFGGDILAFGPFMFSKKLNRQYGDVYIDYMEPLSIRDMVDIEANRQVNARDEFSAHRLSMQQFSEKLRFQLKSLYRLLPMHALASVLSSKGTLAIPESREKISRLIESIQAQPYNLKTLLSMNSDQIVEQGISQLRRFGAINADHGVISIKKPEIISYFSASIDKQGV